MASRAFTIAAILAFGLATGEARVSTAPAGSDGARPSAQWTEVAWPFAFDAWGAGRAFRCPASVCGAELALSIRPKIGFCNCYTGVADDDEIDRVGDVGLLGDYSPLGAGGPVSVGTMAGRARTFLVSGTRSPRYAFGLAVSKKCDAVVATVASDSPLSSLGERAVLKFLSGEAVAPWAEASVGLQ